MSLFQSLNIDATIELNPNVIIAETTNQIIKKKLKHNNFHLKDEQFNHLASTFMQQSIQIGSKLNKKTNFSIRNSQCLDSKLYDQENKFQEKRNSFESQFYNKINQNSLKICSLKIKHKKNIKRPTKKNSHSLLNLNEVIFRKKSLSQLQEMLNTFINSLKYVHKSLEEHKIFSKKKKMLYSDRFKQILRSMLQQFSILCQEKNNQTPKRFERVLWKIKDRNFYIPFEIIAKKIIKLTNKYEHAFKKKEQVKIFLEFVLASQKLQIYQHEDYSFFDSYDVSQNNEIKDFKQLLRNDEDILEIQFEQWINYLIDLFNQNQQNQQFLQSFLEQTFLVYFVKQDFGQDLTNKVRDISFDEDLIFNNYEFHAQPSNLAAFVPSYEQRNHFLLDKFTENENIFQDEEKLMLLLKLSRDPYMPRSSAKYISHMSALIEDIFGLKNNIQQEQQQSEKEKKQKMQRQQQNQQAEEQLKEWQDMFGQLILRI